MYLFGTLAAGELEPMLQPGSRHGDFDRLDHENGVLANSHLT